MLVCDYLIVGAGAASMAFIDTLLKELPKATLILVDRHSAPGGHWNDAYGFVQLHQPSLLYGVSSKQLEGNWLKLLALKQTLPWNHRANKYELLNYYKTMIDKWTASGSLQFFPNCSYDWEASKGRNHIFSSLDGAKTYHVKVNAKLVNGTLGECRVPSTTPPKFTVSEDINLVTPNQLYEKAAEMPSRGWFSSLKNDDKYVVLGAGKTAMDTAVYLQREMGVPAESIQWVIPNDVWMLRRDGRGSPWSWGEALLEADLDMNKAALLLEKEGVFDRVDKTVLPTKLRFPVVSKDEIAMLRKISNVIRRGRVTSINKAEAGQICVEFDKREAEPLLLSDDHIFVHCTSPGPFNGNDQCCPFPSPDVLQLWFLYAPPVPISMSCIAALEARRSLGTLDLDFGRKLANALKGTDNVEYSENEVLQTLITGYRLTAGDDVGADTRAQIEPLKLLGLFFALLDKDPMVGLQWMQQNRLSFFSIPGFKGASYENLLKIVEKKSVLGLSDDEVSMLITLSNKLKALEGK